MPVTITEVLTNRDIRIFINFSRKMYKDVEAYVPSFIGDDKDDWDPRKNPAFTYCEAKRWLAWKDGKPVGRIGAILSHKANDKWGTNRMRFSQMDFIDDPEVSAALFGAVEQWAAEKGCDQIHGPLGFTDMDREGMLVDGFDKRNMFITYYNHPYYNEHMERLGYRKDVDWVEYKIYTPSPDSPEAVKLHRIAEHVKRSRGLHVADIKTRFHMKSLVGQVFALANEAYSPLYGMVELTDEQIKRYASNFIPLLDPRYTCFVLNQQEELVAFGISAPSLASAMKKAKGHMLPFGWVHLLKNLIKNDALDMFLIAVKPELQGAAINAIILDKLIQSAAKGGIRYAETGPQLETNAKILAQWKLFDKELHKRRRCYIKDI
ncbi:MAG: N-acetyltransferase [Ruminococcaceae bacterium]|nr:N-acetyltransferase [Oscillospiraceae bacterium]